VRLIPETRGGMLWRFAFGAVIVIAFTATATAVAGLLQFKQLATDLSLTAPIKHAQVTIADPGNPQTLLLIGSDHRAGQPFRSANTDTMMLVRLDPDSSTINVLSIPRDLRVQIPEAAGFVTDKLNATYSAGGPNLLIKVLRQQVFPGLQVNHIIDVNFGGFEALVDAIGCVYTDVDHRYYNNTLYTGYSSIDIQPGYQKLCDANALAFVRFRHTDTDIVRNARQQDFLRWAKSQYSASELIANRDKLLKIFGAHTETDHDLHTVDGLINLFNLVAFSAGHAIKQIPFPAILLPCNSAAPVQPGVPAAQTPCYVTADPTAEQQAFRQFMTPTTAAAASSAGLHKGHHVTVPPSAKAANLIADPADGKAQAAAMRTGLPVYYPRLIVAGSRYCTNATCAIGPSPNSYPRAYTLHDQSGRPRAAYRMTIVLNPILGEYYGVQGTAWQNPPLLGSPAETRTVAGKRLLLYFNGHKLSTVGWRTPQGAYWISNTLTDDLKNSQMLEIAASLTRAGS
jgi:polyisoprenyl-teichoic acid--peptidoglycan teichoic acid transferase